jgi:hypothetical protein
VLCALAEEEFFDPLSPIDCKPPEKKNIAIRATAPIAMAIISPLFILLFHYYLKNTSTSSKTNCVVADAAVAAAFVNPALN